MNSQQAAGQALVITVIFIAVIAFIFLGIFAPNLFLAIL